MEYSHQPVQLTNDLANDASTHHTYIWRLYPASGAQLPKSPHASTNVDSYVPKENDYVYVRPKSLKELGTVGRVVDVTETSASVAGLQTPNAEPTRSCTKRASVGEKDDVRVSILQDNGAIKHNVRASRLVPIFDMNTNQHNPSNTVVLLTPDTTNYRQLAAAHTHSDDKVLEVGCSTGACTALLLRRLLMLYLQNTGARTTLVHSDSNKSDICKGTYTIQSLCGEIVAFDTGSDMVQQTHQSLQTEFEQLITCAGEKQSDLKKIYSEMTTVHKVDAFADPKRAFSLATGGGTRKYPNLVLIDIGGNRELTGVTRMIRWIQLALARQPPRAIIVKSKELVQELSEKSDGGIIKFAQDWLVRNTGSNNSQHLQSKHQHLPSYSHPLQAPLVLSPKDDKTPICRFHNYHVNGCKKYKDDCRECSLDHDYCHWCRKMGHIARECSS
jgi:hypothetical protein